VPQNEFPWTGSEAPTWDDILGKPAFIAAGEDAATARAAVGAGTSNLALGTTSTTALAGDTAIPAASSTTPAATAAVGVIGVGTTFARADHVHPLNAATTVVIGGVKQAAAQADSVAVDVAAMVVDFNALLAKLRTAGVLAP